LRSAMIFPAWSSFSAPWSILWHEKHAQRVRWRGRAG
jgi:hypothetical protein